MIVANPTLSSLLLLELCILSAFWALTRLVLSLRRHSLQQFVSVSIHRSYAFFVFILLRTLLHRQKCYLQSFHALPHSLHKTPGVAAGLPSFFESIPRFNHCFTSNSHRITFFAYPHPLTPIKSHLFRNTGEGVQGGAPSPAQASSSLSRIPPPPTSNFQPSALKRFYSPLATHYSLPIP